VLLAGDKSTPLTSIGNRHIGSDLPHFRRNLVSSALASAISPVPEKLMSNQFTIGPQENHEGPVPLVGDCVNVSQVCSWINYCEMHHGDRCNIAEYQPAALITDMKLIDVMGKRIIDAPLNARYFALSYIWGGVAQLHLTSENESSLLSYGILERFQDQVPKPSKMP
jgi:hypothetical protein